MALQKKRGVSTGPRKPAATINPSRPKPLREGICQFCGCTDDEPCNPPCSWQLCELQEDPPAAPTKRKYVRDHTVCSTCAALISEIEQWIETSLNPSKGAVGRMVERALSQMAGR